MFSFKATTNYPYERKFPISLDYLAVPFVNATFPFSPAPKVECETKVLSASFLLLSLSLSLYLSFSIFLSLLSITPYVCVDLLSGETQSRYLILCM